MQGIRIRIGVFIILATAGILVPTFGYGGIIETKVMCRTTVEKSGKISLDVEILNDGNDTAYNVIATNFLADSVQRFEDLGHNPPGGRISYRCRFQTIDFFPGRYTAIIQVNFEEQSGRPHRVYHIFEIPYRLDKVSAYNPRLSLNLNHPVFNPKAFWQPERKIRLLMKNGFKRLVKLYIALYLPDGFITRQPSRYYELSPEEERIEEIPLNMERSIRQGSHYHVIVRYEQNGIHYSQRIEGKIKVEEGPIYFRWYLLFGIGALVMLFVVTCYRNREQ